jgi:BlaI family transcriptional regulator, penicillinase repressor
MEKSALKPTESELEILQVLWEFGSSTVRFINDRLNLNKKVGYTTTLKIMQIMTEKGILSRNTESRTHIYSSLISQDDAQQQMLDKLLKTVFGGSAKKLVIQALGNHKSTQTELEEIKKLINDLEGGEK